MPYTKTCLPPAGPDLLLVRGVHTESVCCIARHTVHLQQSADTPSHIQLCCLPRSPLRVPAVQADSLLFRPSIMLHGLLAHYVAEALLNAPQMIGSLELLLNPTGLLQSVGQGFADLIAMPLAAIEARSPSQVSHLQPVFQTNYMTGSGSLLSEQQTKQVCAGLILHGHINQTDSTAASSGRCLSTVSLDK